jgi:hypothetical protein
MKLVHILDPQPYSLLTVHRAIADYCQPRGQRVAYTMAQLQQRRMERDSQVSVVVFESALLKLSRTRVSDLRQFFPGAKLVALGSDTVWYLRGGVHPPYEGWLLYDRAGKAEFFSPHEVDLFLDMLDEVVEAYQARGIRADSWMWTISEAMRSYMENKPLQAKSCDFISLFTQQPSSGDNYRQRLVQHLRAGGVSVQVGGVGYDLDGLAQAYGRARFTLGTTSPSWTTGIRTMKGFRDWIGPCRGSVLLYDDHPDIVRKYTAVPTHPYGDFDALIQLTRSIDYDAVLQAQRAWIAENTIDRQLERLFARHNIV